MQNRRDLLGSLGLMACMSASLVSAQQTASFSRSRSAEWRSQLNQVLRENILQFWLDRSIDREAGGYAMHLDASGKRTAINTKGIVTQARMLWFFSRVARNDFGGVELPDKAQLLSAAKHGWEFLRDIMWDHEHGGFFWMIDPAAERVLMPGKHLYGQSFALYGLAEYYRASGEREARGLADVLVNLLEEHAHDAHFGGYQEHFEPDWAKPAKDARGYLGPAHWKLMNTHLHLMEAFSTWVAAHETPLGRRRLEELVQIQSTAVVRQQIGACTDKYERNWTPILDGANGRISYGHDLENVWLLVDANRNLGRSSYPLLDLFRSLWAYSLRYGYDEKSGGFYDSGDPNQPASKRSKVWWVQAEALVSALTMFELTEDQRYLGIFEQTWNFVRHSMIDTKHGEWHGDVSETGVPSGGKGHNWKSAYHNGRAMIECLQILQRLEHRLPV